MRFFLLLKSNAGKKHKIIRMRDSYSRKKRVNNTGVECKRYRTIS